jgi:uncharacterized protein
MATTNIPKKPHLETLAVILDSNAFFVPLKFKIDIFEELKRVLNRNADLVLLSAVKSELETLANEKSVKVRREAFYALRVAEKCIFVKVETKSLNVDDTIVLVAKEWNSPVFTNDRQLKNKLRDISVPVIYVRQKTRLEIDGLI